MTATITVRMTEDWTWGSVSCAGSGCFHVCRFASTVHLLCSRRQDHNHRTADQLLPGEEKWFGGPHGAPAVLCKPLGTGVSVLLCFTCKYVYSKSNDRDGYHYDFIDTTNKIACRSNILMVLLSMLFWGEKTTKYEYALLLFYTKQSTALLFLLPFFYQLIWKI